MPENISFDWDVQFLGIIVQNNPNRNFDVLLVGNPGLPATTVEGVDLLVDVLHGYEARVQGNPQVLDGQGFKMMESISTTSKALEM